MKLQQIYLNDLDVSANYMERLIDETLQRLPQVFIEPEMIKVQDELEGFKDIGNRFRSVCKVRVSLILSLNTALLTFILKAGLEQLFNQLTRPRLRPILDDAYRDVNYLLDDDTFQEAEEMDLMRKRFVKSWDNLVLGYRVRLFIFYCLQ